jgi:hypothetical protein
MSVRRRYGLAAAAAGLFSVTAVSVAAAQGSQALAPTSVLVDARPIDSFEPRVPERTRFGALAFRGGLTLRSNHKPFGGISGLHMEPDGSHFFAVTDRGFWVKGRIVYADNGRPAGLADVQMAPMLGPDGAPLTRSGIFDSESLTERDGIFYVGYERVHKILRFDLRKEGFAARGQPIPVPADFKTFKFNKSLECLAAPPKGAPLAGKLIAVTEGTLDPTGNLRAYVLDDDAVQRFAVKRSDDFEVSDCAILPKGDLLLLERSFSVSAGIAMRIRRIPLSQIKEGAVIDGPVLITADLGYEIDNMEGLGISRTTSGEIVLTIVSDDNFSVIQRNVLLQFTLLGE